MTGELGPVRAVMLFVDDPHAVASWYAPLFGIQEDAIEVEAERRFACFDADGVEVAFHPADASVNPLGRSSVVYWSVSSLDAARAELISRGAEHLRGPLDVDADRAICQLVDPFGNVFGLDGPR